jgi:YhcH/YjgK/YiaL family protein
VGRQQTCRREQRWNGCRFHQEELWERIMILDRLEHAEQYGNFSKELAMAFDYLRRTDFSKAGVGRHEIDGDRVFAIVQRYCPKPWAEAKWEAHQQYLDVQYMVTGGERMGYAPLVDGLKVEKDYDSQKDYAMYYATGDLIAVREGSFAIFAPQDIHAPGLAMDAAGAANEVCKVVVKCRL